MVRVGMWVALAGLVVAGLAALCVVADVKPYTSQPSNLGFFLILLLAGAVGLVITAAGLLLAGVGALARRADRVGKP